MRSGPLHRTPVAGLTGLALLAFAANSLLCRAALAVEDMDAASFTVTRLVTGALALSLLVRARARGPAPTPGGAWVSALALLAYATLFALAYRTIPAGVGALVLFCAVQLTMLGAAIAGGTGPRGSGWLGVVLALAGLALLTLPGATAPEPGGVLLMTGSGVAWGIYSLRGRRVAAPVRATAASFRRASVLVLPLAALAWLVTAPRVSAPALGLATLSGAGTSGLGYVVWYAALPALGATRAAIVQLAVPVIAAAAGAALLGEALSARLLLSSAAILGGIALVLRAERTRAGTADGRGAPGAAPVGGEGGRSD